MNIEKIKEYLNSDNSENKVLGARILDSGFFNADTIEECIKLFKEDFYNDNFNVEKNKEYLKILISLKNKINVYPNKKRITDV